MSEIPPHSQAAGGDQPDEVDPAPIREGEEPSSYVDDPMALLWQNSDRPTGAEAVEAIRARHKAADPANGSGSRRRRGRAT